MIIHNILGASLFALGALFITDIIVSVAIGALRRTHIPKNVIDLARNIIWAIGAGIILIYVLSLLGLSQQANISVIVVAAFSLLIQQTVGNVFDGAFILVQRPFQIGDIIVVGGDCGVVQSIGLIFTKMSDPDTGDIIIKTNSSIYSIGTIRKRKVNCDGQTVQRHNPT